MDVYRDAAAVVRHTHHAIRQERHLNLRCKTAHGLVAAIIKNLGEHVVEAVNARRANVHAGAFAHRLQTLQDKNVFRPVALRF